MRPHEETWYEAGGDVFVQVSTTRSDADHLVMYGDHRGPRKRLIVAAPEIARALLQDFGSFGGENDAEWHTNECWAAQQGPGRVACARRCRTTKALLTKAGVIP